MMPELGRIYDAAFFREWGRNNRAYVESARLITRVLHEEFKPASLVDLGAGCGVYSDAFRTLGVRVLSVDGVVPPEADAFPMNLQIRDLTVPFENPWGSFDLTLCLEVAEHIPEELCGPFLDNLVQFADSLVISCAPPMQEGTHHVNLQPKRYWIEKLGERGFEYDRRRTGRLLEIFKPHEPRIEFAWMYQQISVYERSFA